MQYQGRDKSGYTELVTTAECVSHLYLPADADTTLMTAYILTARRWVEQYCGLPLIKKCDCTLRHVSTEQRIYTAAAHHRERRHHRDHLYRYR